MTDSSTHVRADLTATIERLQAEGRQSLAYVLSLSLLGGSTDKMRYALDQFRNVQTRPLIG